MTKKASEIPVVIALDVLLVAIHQLKLGSKDTVIHKAILEILQNAANAAREEHQLTNQVEHDLRFTQTIQAPYGVRPDGTPKELEDLD